MGLTKTVTTPLAGTNVSAADFGAPVVADIQSIISDKRVYTETDGATITFNQNNGAAQLVVLGDNRTLALGNVSSDSIFFIILGQDGTGSRTVTWFSTIRWVNNVTPTLTTTASKYDIFGFIEISTGNYLGMTLGKNM